MRNWPFALVVLIAGLVGYALNGDRVEAQFDSMPFSESVVLFMEGGRTSAPCAVIGHRDGFIGCAAAAPRPETWFNLRFVAEIRTAK